MNTKTFRILVCLLSSTTLYCPFMPNTRALQEKANSASESNENPLLRSSLYKQETTAQLEGVLALKKYDPNELDSETYLSPLAQALSAPTPAALILLIKGGADPNKPYLKGVLAMTPLMGAIEQKKVAHVAALLVAGANPNYANVRSYPLLSASCLSNWVWKEDNAKKLEIIALLFRYGANPLIEHTQHRTLTKQLGIDFMMHSGSKNAETVAAWKRVGRALIKYKIAQHIFHKTLSLPKEIADNILRFVDFELEDPSKSPAEPTANS